MKQKKININFKHISPLPILNYSGFSTRNCKIPTAKKHCYTIIKDVSVTGDAPKDILRLYEYGIALKRNYKKWPIYIAKLGHKYYPMESITEQLLTDVGLAYGFNMATSKICVIGGQIRFLSLYFLDHKEDELFHGADMYAGYLNNDKLFVDEVEDRKMTQDFFTIKFTREVIDYFFKDNNKDKIFGDFMRMLFFDGLIGNNDRHMYNWGVVRNIFGKKKAVFAPIYDTARGLLWNTQEHKINTIIKNNEIDRFVRKYCMNSKPKIGIEGKELVNHFDMIKHFREYYIKDEFVSNIFTNDTINDVIDMINTKFNKLLSKNRYIFINKILLYRYNKIKEILSYGK